MSTNHDANKDLRRALENNALLDSLQAKEDKPKSDREILRHHIEASSDLSESLIEKIVRLYIEPSSRLFESLIEKYQSWVDPDFLAEKGIKLECLKQALSDVLYRIEQRKYYDLRARLQRRLHEKASQLLTKKRENFNLSTEASPDELQRVFNRRKDLYGELAPLHIPGRKEDGTPICVPVLIDDPKKLEDTSYHTVTLVRGTARAEILISQNNNYVVAFKVYNSETERLTRKWCVFNDTKIPETTFGDTQGIHYDSGHDNLENIQFWRYTLDQIFSVLASLQDNPDQPKNDVTKRILVMLFVILGEGQRFAKLQQFLIENIQSEVLVELDPKIANLFNVWKKLCIFCFQYHQAELEQPLHDKFVEAYKQEQYELVSERRLLAAMHPAASDNDAVKKIVEDVISEAAKMARIQQYREQLLKDMANPYLNIRKQFETMAKSKHGEGILNFACLTGNEILLLNGNTTHCVDIMLRMCGYTGSCSIIKQKDEGEAYLDEVESKKYGENVAKSRDPKPVQGDQADPQSHGRKWNKKSGNRGHSSITKQIEGEAWLAWFDEVESKKYGENVAKSGDPKPFQGDQADPQSHGRKWNKKSGNRGHSKEESSGGEVHLRNEANADFLDDRRDRNKRAAKWADMRKPSSGDEGNQPGKGQSSGKKGGQSSSKKEGSSGDGADQSDDRRDRNKRAAKWADMRKPSSGGDEGNQSGKGQSSSKKEGSSGVGADQSRKQQSSGRKGGPSKQQGRR